MKLTKIANQAVNEISDTIKSPIPRDQLEKVTSIIVRAMEDAILEASDLHSLAYVNHLSHDQDLAHKIQKEIELKKTALIANLSSLR